MVDGPDLRRLTGAGSLPEAEMISGLLAEAGIRVLIRRTSAFDVPDFLAAGPRELLVRSEDFDAARDLVEAHFGLR